MATPPKAVARAVAKGPGAHGVRVPTEHDLDVAKEDALLQLRIGQAAHYYTIIVAAAFLTDIALVLFFQPDLVAVAPAALKSTFFLLFPIVGGIYLSVFGLRVKWEVYQLWPWEGHFWATVLAVVYNAGVGYVYFASLLHFGPTAHWELVPWFYPFVLLGLTSSLVALALTWPGWPQRKVVSVLASILPIPFAFAVYLPSLSPSLAIDNLALTLALSAVLYLISGGFLHIISSGTRVHEREIITSGQTKIFQVAEEVRQREEKVTYREKTLDQREIDLSDAEAGLRRRQEAHELLKGQLDQVETDLRARQEALAEKEQAFQATKASVIGQQHQVGDRETTLALREQELTDRLPKLAEREQHLSRRESECRQKEVDLLRREQELERRLQGVPESEANLEKRRQELDRRTAELLQKESELRTRAAAPAAMPAAGASPSADVERREAQLNQLKLALDEQNATLGRRSRQLQDSLQDILRREGELAKRQSDVDTRETGLRQRETDAKDRFDLGESRRNQYEEAVRRFEERAAAVEKRDLELASRSAELDRVSSGLKLVETQLKQREEQLSTQRTGLDRIQRSLAERGKALDAREDRLALAGKSPAGGTEEARPDFLFAQPVARKHADRAPTGTPRLDDLLAGGIPPRGHLMLVGAPFVGKEVVLHGFLAEGLKRGEPAIIVTASRSPEELSQQIGEVLPAFREFEQKGKVQWIDASRTSPDGARPDGHPNVTVVKSPDDHPGILSALVSAAKRLESGRGEKGAAPASAPLRVGFFGLSSSLAHAEERAGFVFLQNFVGILKPRRAVAMYTLEAGALPEARVEQILTRMDGAIRFKQEGDKTFLSVAGVDDVQTREWIEVRATPKSLVIGSFSLERIK